MWFFPIEPARESSSRYTLCGLMRERFESYKNNMRENFFDTHFADFDRQVVLVDVLSALHAGRAAFSDTEHAIADIAKCLSYGSNSLALLWQLGGTALDAAGNFLAGPYSKAVKKAAKALSAKHIERVAFVATKSDHVPAMRRENLKNLLRALAETTQKAPMGDGRMTYHTVASVLSTKDGTEKVHGHPFEVVWGLPRGEERQRAFYPGDVPSGRPPETFWSDRFFELPVFAPPRIDPTGATGIPHHGIDDVLVALLKDIL
jgi:hypothetical protein